MEPPPLLKHAYSWPCLCMLISSLTSLPALPSVFQNGQRLGSSQVGQSLTTPVVSVATPSLLAPFSGMQTAYNTGELV